MSEETTPKIQPPSAIGTEAMVCRDIATRQAHGLSKYGVSVAENPLTMEQWLQHLYEELLDGAVYAKRAIGMAETLREELAAAQSANTLLSDRNLVLEGENFGLEKERDKAQAKLAEYELEEDCRASGGDEASLVADAQRGQLESLQRESRWQQRCFEMQEERDKARAHAHRSKNALLILKSLLSPEIPDWWRDAGAAEAVIDSALAAFRADQPGERGEVASFMNCTKCGEFRGHGHVCAAMGKEGE